MPLKSEAVHAHRPEDQMLCPQCDLMVALPPLSPGNRANCPRCHTTLHTAWSEPRHRPTVFAASALLMLLLANLFPFINIHVRGLSSEISLHQIPQVMMSENYASMAGMFILFVQLVPAFCMVAIILLCQRVRMPQTLKVRMARLLFMLKAWSMVEIFLAGVLVSFVKLMAYGNIGVNLSFYAFVLFCLLQVRAFQCLDRRWLWHDIAPAPVIRQAVRIGESGLQQGLRACPCCTAVLPADETLCPRCHTVGHLRKKHSLQWTMALLITSAMLYVPANVLPIMNTELLGNAAPSTIMAGVIVLWSDGDYPVALVIFIASIMVPTLKMMAIAWLCWDARHPHRQRDSERMHLIYEVVEFVGRWSMIDVFVIAVLSSLVRIGQLMNVYPQIAAVLFAMVVILTMIAAMTFDPRLSWDGLNRKNQKELHLDSK